MSSRQLRKLQQQRELEQATLQAKAESPEESDEEPVVATKTKASLFANLAGLEDQDEEEDEEDEEPEAEVETDIRAPVAAPKKAKKSKKKKKAKSKAKETEPAAEPSNGADEIDAALRELNLKQPAGKPDSTSTPLDPEYERICALLGVNAQYLKVANEMRSLFGRDAVEVQDNPGGPTGRGGRRRQRAQNQQVDLESALKGQHAPGKGLPELTLRRNSLIQGKDDWPKAPTGGLTMVMVDDQRTTDGTVEFRFDHNQMYQTLQENFYGFVEMGDPQNLIGLLVRNPYHISLLIQVSKIAKDQTDHALSSDLLERALFTFGRAATSLFNTQLATGKARLDFARPENRELWLAGYQYIKSLVMKGTYRTAFEWAKLLLALDPEEDPYCMRFMIHHLALRAGEFNWLLDLKESQLPFHWTGKDGQAAEALSYYLYPSFAFAAMSLKQATECREILSVSMQRVPWLFCRLFKELNLDAPPSIWGIEPRSDSETLFTEIYVQQTKDLWNTPEATALLMEIAHTIPKVIAPEIIIMNDHEMTLDVTRFVYLDNTPSLMALAPSHLLHRSNNSDADPLPPVHNVTSYAAQRRALGPHDDLVSLEDDYMDPLAAIARLLPDRFRGGTIEDGVDDGVSREELRELVERGAEASNPYVPVNPGVVGRLMSFFSYGIRPGENDDEDEDINTDTDDEMPELVAR